MKKLVIVICLCSVACEIEEATPTVPVNDTFDPTMAQQVSMGMIMGINHTVSGTATIYLLDGKHTLLLDPFSSQNGPDLKVYLSKDVGATNYLRLGALQSTMGKQSYSIPSGISLSDYPYVHVWCEQFSVEFARAEMK
ncbi:MAG TPA: DM13 domain-containing protein [Cyclobacteriaceae bacterium]|nr:DM13 domain-containing protein [Cyclobacteriaceae bacterium]